MKNCKPIEIRVGDLKPALVGLGKITRPNAPDAIHRCIRVERANKSEIRLQATDGDFHLNLKAPAKVIDPVEPFLVPLEALREQVRGCKAADSVLIRPNAKAPAVSEFPGPPAFRAASVELPPKITSSLLRAFACSSSDPSRFVLQGAYLDVSGKGRNAHRIVATDGRQLFSSNSMELSSLKSSVILPNHVLWKWKRMTAEVPWILRVGAEKGGDAPFRISTKDWSLSGKTISGNYPNYRQVIPPGSDFKSRAEMSREVAEAIANLIPKLPGKKLSNKPVGLHIEKGLVSLLARETTEEPWQFYPIGPVKAEGPDQIVFANRDYVQRATGFGLTSISTTDQQSPMQFSREGDLMIVMPVRVGDTEKLKRPRKLAPIVSTKQPKSPQSPAKKAVSKKRATAPPATSDPMDEIEVSIAEANKALASAGKKLKSAKGSLNTARDQRTEDQEELKGFRSLFRSIKKLATGSN